MNGSMCPWKVRLFSSRTETPRIVAAVALPRPDEMILFTMESVEGNPNELFYASLDHDAQVASSCTDTSRIVKNRTLPKIQWQFKRSNALAISAPRVMMQFGAESIGLHDSALMRGSRRSSSCNDVHRYVQNF